MDVDRLLNLERRTGVKDGDIGEFERKVNDVEAAIKGLMDGTIKPEDVKVEGIETEEEKMEKERQRQERRRAYEEREAKLREERKKEERERWWAGVEIFKPNMKEGETAPNIATDEENDKKTAILNRYKADYSRWGTWTPTDEVSLAEAAEIQQREEDARNKEFEKNNSEFCTQFVTDMENRKKVTEKKQESADISRLKGNRYFKTKAYDKALEYYMDALKDCPFDAKTLNNIAQVYIKTKSYEDALEFLARTLYLEPSNVKALSRKALVLGEQGNVTEAVAIVQAALAVEPGNADLVAQARELAVIDAERAAEQRVNQAVQQPAEASTPAATAISASSGSATGVVGRLLAEVKRFSQLLEEDADTSSSSLRVNLEGALVGLRGQSEGKVYARTAGLVDAVAVLSKTLCTARTKSADFASLLPITLNLLAELVDGQRASKLLLLDHKILSALKALLQNCGCSSVANDVDTTAAALTVLHVCCADDISVKSRTVVIGDKLVLGLLAGIMGNVSFRVSTGSAERDSSLRAAEVRVVELCARILKVAAFADSVNSGLPTLDALAGASVVCGITSSLHMTRCAALGSAKPPVSNPTIISKEDLLELLIEAALGASQVEVLRVHFALESPVTVKGKDPVSVALCAEIVRVIASYPALEVNATAALMNACLEPSNAVRRAIVEAGGGEVATTQLALSDSERAKLDGVTLVRRAGLLGRLAGEEAVQKLLLRPDKYRLLCRRLTLPRTSPGTGPEQWQVDERAHYVRILASLSSPPAECLAVGMAENVLPALLAIFPTPREDCGEITATSVTLVPHDLAPALVLGNAARCLMPYADVPAYAEQLYGAKSKLQGVEKLICAMASCPDMRVRKNIAILLAKGCRVPGVRERMTALRGMQMMVELQNSL